MTNTYSQALSTRELIATLDVASLKADMGLTQSPYTLMNPPGGTTWQLSASITSGSRCHGDAQPNWWVTGLTQTPAGLLTNYWNGITPWVTIYPSATNLCTNAAIKVTDVQTYLLSASTGAWSRPYYDNLYPQSLDWWDLNVATDRGAADRYYPNGNIPAFTNVYLAADRVSVDVGPTTSKYKRLHNGWNRGQIPTPSDVAAIMVTCKSRLVPIVTGAAFNGTPEILLSIGADLYPNMTDNVGQGLLIGATNVPGVGASRFALVPQDGTQRRHYFITYVGVNTTIDNSSVYAIANPNGVGRVLTDAQLSANPPSYIVQQTV